MAISCGVWKGRLQMVLGLLVVFQSWDAMSPGC